MMMTGEGGKLIVHDGPSFTFSSWRLELKPAESDTLRRYRKMILRAIKLEYAGKPYRRLLARAEALADIIRREED